MNAEQFRGTINTLVADWAAAYADADSGIPVGGVHVFYENGPEPDLEKEQAWLDVQLRFYSANIREKLARPNPRPTTVPVLEVVNERDIALRPAIYDLTHTHSDDEHDLGLLHDLDVLAARGVTPEERGAWSGSGDPPNSRSTIRRITSRGVKCSPAVGRRRLAGHFEYPITKKPRRSAV